MDAMFTIWQVISKCVEFKEPHFMAFVDLGKAYDSVWRKLLWQIMRVYIWCACQTSGADDRPALQYLFQPRYSNIRVLRQLRGWMSLCLSALMCGAGARQGCVMFSLLCCTGFGSRLWPRCQRVVPWNWAYHADGKLQRKKWGRGGSLELLSVLLYADVGSAVCRRHGVDEQR